MLSQEIKTLSQAGLIFWIGLSGCSQKPAIKIKALPAERSDMKSENLAMLPEIQATLSDEDWKRLQGLIPIILRRIEAMEGAVLWLPQGTMLVSAQTAVLIERAEALNEKSDTLIELTERMLKEAQKTREALGLMLKPPMAKN